MGDRNNYFDTCNVFDVELSETVAHEGKGTCRVRRIAERATAGASLEGECNFVDVAVIPPGCSIGRHRHQKDEEELYLILEGSGLMWREGREQRVRAGDLLRTPAGGAHGLVNDTDRDLRIFVFELRVAATEVVGLVFVRDRRVLLEQRRADARVYAGVWDTPGGKIEPKEEPAAAMIREAREELGVELSAIRLLAVFDDVDATSGRRFRHHVFSAEPGGEIEAKLGQRLEWFAIDRLHEVPALSPIVPRSLAAFEMVTTHPIARV